MGPAHLTGHNPAQSYGLVYSKFGPAAQSALVLSNQFGSVNRNVPAGAHLGLVYSNLLGLVYLACKATLWYSIKTRIKIKDVPKNTQIFMVECVWGILIRTYKTTKFI